MSESGAGRARRARIGETLSAAVHWRAAAREVARLEAEGYVRGASYDLVFSLAFAEPETIPLAVLAVRFEGFTVTELAGVERGFVTVRTPIRLRTFDLARAAARITRVARRHEGFVALVGAAHPAAAPAAAPRRERPSGRNSGSYSEATA